MIRNVLQVAGENSAKLAMVDDIYAYGKSNGGKVNEDSPKQPNTKKGKLRLKQLEMIKNSGVPYVVAHFPDFYGPNAHGTMLGTTLRDVVKNKNSMFVGSIKVQREHIFTPDGAKAIVTLAQTEKAYGQTWNIPDYDTIIGEEIIQLIRDLTGDKFRLAVSPSAVFLTTLCRDKKGHPKNEVICIRLIVLYFLLFAHGRSPTVEQRDGFPVPFFIKT